MSKMKTAEKFYNRNDRSNLVKGYHVNNFLISPQKCTNHCKALRFICKLQICPKMKTAEKFYNRNDRSNLVKGGIM